MRDKGGSVPGTKWKRLELLPLYLDQTSLQSQTGNTFEMALCAGSKLNRESKFHKVCYEKLSLNIIYLVFRLSVTARSPDGLAASL